MRWWRRFSSALPLLAWLILVAGLQAAPRRTEQALLTARAATPLRWPLVRQQLVQGLSAAYPQQADSLALGELLDQARSLTNAEFQAREVRLRIALTQASQGPVYAGWESLAPDAYNGPLFDAHNHALNELKPRQLAEKLQEAGLLGMIMFGPKTATGQEQFHSVRRYFPTFVHPFALMPPDPRTGRQRLSEAALVSLQKQLEEGSQGIGELPLRHADVQGKPGKGNSEPADGPLALRVYDLAARFRVPVVMHVSPPYAAEVGRAAAHNPNTVIVWAHCGDTGAAVVRELLEEHHNLRADLSDRNPLYSRRPLAVQSITRPDGQLKPAWKSLLEDFPDRFMFGLDFSDGDDRDQKLPELLDYYRNLLGQLPRETAERIAYKNAEELLKHR